MEKLLLQFIPIVIIFMLTAYSKSTAQFSRTILGKLLAVCVIVFYTCIDKLYGLLVCGFIILYYQSRIIESMLNYGGGGWTFFDIAASLDHIDSSSYTADDPVYIGGLVESFMPLKDAYRANTIETGGSTSEFRNKNCKNGTLMNKTIPVRLDMTEHVYPEVKFHDAPCNTCSKTCGFSITEAKIQKEIDLKSIYSK